MKNLKITSLLLLLLSFVACKKDKNADINEMADAGELTFQGQKMAIDNASYKDGNGDGAWIYFYSEARNVTLQIRFSKLADYEIPVGSFTLKKAEPYNPKLNFSGGKVGVSTANSDTVDELSSGTVEIKKNGERYEIIVNGQTAKGEVTVNYRGKLQKQGS